MGVSARVHAVCAIRAKGAVLLYRDHGEGHRTVSGGWVIFSQERQVNFSPTVRSSAIFVSQITECCLSRLLLVDAGEVKLGVGGADMGFGEAELAAHEVGAFDQ